MSDEPTLLPPIPLFVAHASIGARDPWRWLWRFDQRLVRLAAEPSEPMLAQIRLAWWRDQLSGQGKAAERRDPMLIELDGLDEQRRFAVEQAAAELVDAMEAMAVGEARFPIEGAEHRGEALAHGLVRLLVADEVATKNGGSGDIGRFWGLAQLAPVASGDADWRERIGTLAKKADEAKAPRALSLMRLHGRLLVNAGGDPLGPGAGLRLMAHALSGL